jgi:hypothetical protein
MMNMTRFFAYPSAPTRRSNRVSAWQGALVLAAAATLTACGGGGGGGTTTPPTATPPPVTPPVDVITPAAAPSYDKIGASGEVLGAGTTTFSCVRDRATGLYWDTSTASPVYSSQTDAAAAPAAANTARKCGIATWRVPEVYELAFQSDVSKASPPLIDTGAFPQHLAKRYWSATSFAGAATAAWLVDFSNGTTSTNNKVQAPGSDFRAISVSGAKAVPENCTGGTDDLMTDNGNGTVTDRRTGLMWMQCQDGRSGANCATGAGASYGWGASFSRATAVNGNASLNKSFSDWRVPSQRELASIVRPYCAAPTINQLKFPSTESVFSYWSASPDTQVSGASWYVDFAVGDVGSTVSGSKFLRLVRTTP